MMSQTTPPMMVTAGTPTPTPTPTLTPRFELDDASCVGTDDAEMLAATDCGPVLTLDVVSVRDVSDVLEIVLVIMDSVVGETPMVVNGVGFSAASINYQCTASSSHC